MKTRDGFTLIEFLIVMVMVFAIALISYVNFSSSEMKTRDAQRKSDIREIAVALSAYTEAHGGYPLASPEGQMLTCNCNHGSLACNWLQDLGEREFCDKDNVVYMSKVPGDPSGKTPYCYTSDGQTFGIYANLENSRDVEARLNVTCVGRKYNFGMESNK